MKIKKTETNIPLSDVEQQIFEKKTLERTEWQTAPWGRHTSMCFSQKHVDYFTRATMKQEFLDQFSDKPVKEGTKTIAIFSFKVTYNDGETAIMPGVGISQRDALRHMGGDWADYINIEPHKTPEGY